MKHPHTYIIAEIGVNHNGDLQTAIKMIQEAKKAGVDAVKFQSFIPELLVTKQTCKADYQLKHSGDNESQLEMLMHLSLSADEQMQLMQYCREIQIDFLSSPFDLHSVNLLINKLHLPCIKIGSGELTNAPLLLKVAEADVRIILSTGMSTLDEIEQALGVIAFGFIRRHEEPSISEFKQAFNSDEGQRVLKNNVTLLHCTSEYPCPYHDVNLRAMDTLSKHFNLAIGLSDHSQGISVSLAAVARGATIIEKHFTLDRTDSGPDHQASIEPQQLSDLVQQARQIEIALGVQDKNPVEAEERTKSVVRKHLVAAKGIAAGELFSEDNLTVKRVDHGLSPVEYWSYLGKTADRNYKTDDVIEP